MSTSATAFPLTWPTGFKRAKYRIPGSFKTPLHAALANVERSLRLFASDSGKKIEDLTISSNVTLGQQRPADPGVAVWFRWDGLQVCIPIDIYQKVEANLQAIHHVLEGRRAELRHGGFNLVRATFTGLSALPYHGVEPWWEVLGIPGDSTPDQIKARFRELAKAAHSDAGGSDDQMARLNAAYETALNS